MAEDMAPAMVALQAHLSERLFDLKERIAEVRLEVGQMRLQQIENTERLIGLEHGMNGNGGPGVADRLSAVDQRLEAIERIEQAEHWVIRGLAVAGGVGVGFALKVLAGA